MHAQIGYFEFTKICKYDGKFLCVESIPVYNACTNWLLQGFVNMMVNFGSLPTSLQEFTYMYQYL